MRIQNRAARHPAAGIGVVSCFVVSFFAPPVVCVYVQITSTCVPSVWRADCEIRRALYYRAVIRR